LGSKRGDRRLIDVKRKRKEKKKEKRKSDVKSGVNYL